MAEQTNLSDAISDTAVKTLQKAAEYKPTKPDQTAVKEQKRILRSRFGEYIPKGADPIKMYRQWKGSIFPDPDATDDNIMHYVLGVAKSAGIDPTIPKQIYALPFNTKNKRTQQYEVKFNIVVGIEGMVTIAEGTGTYGGTTKPEYEFVLNEDGSPDTKRPISCTIGVYKVVQGVLVTSEQTVYFDEYDTGKNMWATKPLTMIKKVAHAHAIRAAFSACKGLNIIEELEQNDVIDVDRNGGVIKTTSTAKIQDDVKKCMTTDELQAYYSGLSQEDKSKALAFVEKRFADIEG